MPYDPQIHHRHSLRLGNYDYAQAGAYFVTFVTQKRRNIFGEVINSEMILSAAGEIACQVWLDLPNHYPYVELDAFILMPNHLHGILVYEPHSSSGSTNPETTAVIHPLSEIVRGFKSFSASRINALFHKPGFSVW